MDSKKVKMVRSRAVAIIFPLFLLAISEDANASCPNVQYRTSYIDEMRQYQPASEAAIANLHFRAYVGAAGASIRRTIEKNSSICGANRPYIVSILYVYRPIEKMPRFKSGPTEDAFLAHIKAEKSNLDSPWVSASFDRKSGQMYLMMTLNERQILLDQALLTGAKSVNDRPQSLESYQLKSYIYEYRDLSSKYSVSKGRVNNPIGIPIDIYWLLSKTWQSDLAPLEGSFHSDLSIVVTKSNDNYVSLSSALIERFLSIPPQKLTYGSVTGLSKIYDLNSYKIDRIHK